jgi:hypothetical protein
MEVFNGIETRDRFSGDGFPFNLRRFRGSIEIRFGQSKPRRKKPLCRGQYAGRGRAIGDGGENDSWASTAQLDLSKSRVIRMSDIGTQHSILSPRFSVKTQVIQTDSGTDPRTPDEMPSGEFTGRFAIGDLGSPGRPRTGQDSARNPESAPALLTFPILIPILDVPLEGTRWSGPFPIRGLRLVSTK